MVRILTHILAFVFLLTGGVCLLVLMNASIMSSEAEGAGIEFGPPPVRLEVKPLQSDSPVRTELVLVATLTDSQGRATTRRRIDWNLEGVGNIVEVDPGSLFQGRGSKTNNSATTYTSTTTRSIGRHNGNPSDEIMISPGQSWIVITSAIEGDTEVTVSAPDIANWDNKRMVATRRWSNADWQFPTPALGPAGMPLSLTTSLFRRNDRQPIQGYQVRYRFLDGTSTQFLPGLANEITVQSDASGKAVANLAQVNPVPGRGRIGIEILKPNQGNSGSNAPLATGEAIVEWQQPGIMLRETCPSSVLVGQELVCRMTVTNTTLSPLGGLTVRCPVAEAANFVRAEPPAIKDGSTLVWTLDSLGSRGAASFDIVYQPKMAGTLIGRANVRTPSGLHDERTYQVKVNPVPKPMLQIEPVGSRLAMLNRTGDQVVGQPLSLQLVVSNTGTDPAPNAQLHVDLEEGLKADSGQSSLDWDLGTMAPGTRKTVNVMLKPTKTGTSHVKASATAEVVSASADKGNAVSPKTVLAKIEPLYTIRESGLELKLKAPTVRYVGTAFHWSLDLKNSGNTPLTQITVSTLLPQQLNLVEATDNGRLQGNEVVWLVDRLEPGQSRTLKMSTRGNAMGPQVVVQARASATMADSGAPTGKEGQLTSNSGGNQSPPAPVGQPVLAGTSAAVTLQGMPAFRMRIDARGPAEVGDRVIYRIFIENTGSTAGNNIQLSTLLPPQMKLLAARGMNYRIDGSRVTFAPLATVTPGQKLEFSVDLLAEKQGDARFRAELTTGFHSPIVQENSLHIVGKGD